MKQFIIRNTFRAHERLKREQHIDTLFRKGKAYSVFPLKFIYVLAPRGEDTSAVRVGFSVPKKNFRKSVQRQRLKRLMREAWRLQKQTLYDAVPVDKQLHLFLVFTGKEVVEYPPVFDAVTKGIENLVTSLRGAAKQSQANATPPQDNDIS